MVRYCAAVLLIGIILDTGLPTKSATVRSCGHDLLSFNGSCYLLGHGKMDFTEAENYCQQHGSHLIEVETAPENTFITDQLRHINANCYWMGLTDAYPSFKWHWISSKTSPTFTDWHNGHPARGDCGVFYPGWDYKWATYFCSSHLCSPLCEAPDPDKGSRSSLKTKLFMPAQNSIVVMSAAVGR